MATEIPHPQPLTRCHTYLGGTHRALRSGQGIYIFENQFFRYEGEWVKGKKHGFGKLLLKDGTYYEGQFNLGEITGNGFKYFSATKCKYKGQFFKGEMHGRGCMEYPDGAIYDGTFVHNRKNGYGVMKTPFTSYTGGYEQNMRHGQGCMVYAPMRLDKTSNGDRYEGYWEADKRHGRGVLHCADGSLYDGNFYYDEFSGRGLYRHVSGVVYDGMWNDGFPANMACKLKIVIDKSPMVIRQGTPFSITVQCLNDEGEVIADEGREIQITAGFRYYKPSKGSALFDMIEDVEDKPIDTPFGYQVVHYPMTNQVPDQPNDPAEDEDEKEDELTASTTQLDKVDEDENQNADEVKEGEEGGDNEEKADEEKVEGDDGEKPDEEPEETSQNIEKESIPLPPPVPTSRTEEGVSVWDNLQLAPAPPMYRPFVAMEEAENESKKGSRSKGSVKQVEKRMKAKEKALEEKYAKTGEYVLMLHDVTTPPFLGRTLEPDFLLLKLKRPEPKKRKEKEGKKWDTSQHIRSSMVVTEEDD